MSGPFTGIVSCTFSTRSVTLMTSTSSEIVPGYGVSDGAAMSGGSGTGDGPGEYCARTAVVRAMHKIAKTAVAPLRWKNECGMQFLRNQRSIDLGTLRDD